MSAPTLPYAPNPTVGCLQATEENGVVTVTASLTRDRLLRYVRIPAIFTLGVMTLASAWCFLEAPIPWAISLLVVPVGIAVIAFFLFGAILHRPIYISRHRPSWEASPKGLRVRARTPTNVEDVFHARSTIALVVAEKFFIPPNRKPAPGTRIFFTSGQPYGLLFGTQPEAEFLAARLSHGLGLAGWTPTPPSFRTRIRAYGLEHGLLILIPQRNPTLRVVLCGALAFAFSALTLRALGVPTDPAVGLAAIPGLIALFVPATLLKRFSRATRFLLTSTVMNITESGFKPSQESLPSPVIVGVMLKERRLEIVFQNSPSRPVFEGLKKTELQHLKAVIEEWLARKA